MNTAADFFQAIKTGDLNLVREELRRDSSLATSRADSGESPLLLAQYYGHEDIVQALLDGGAEPDICEAAALGEAERARALILRSPELVNAYSDDGFTPLQLAAYFGHAVIVEMLLEKGADVRPAARNPMGITALHAALAGKSAGARERIGRALVERGADVNAVQPGGFTPLHSAAQNGDLAIAKLLLDKGANSNAATDKGQTPLDFAEEGAHAELATLLRTVSGAAD